MPSDGRKEDHEVVGGGEEDANRESEAGIMQERETNPDDAASPRSDYTFTSQCSPRQTLDEPEAAGEAADDSVKPGDSSNDAAAPPVEPQETECASPKSVESGETAARSQQQQSPSPEWQSPSELPSPISPTTSPRQYSASSPPSSRLTDASSSLPSNQPKPLQRCKRCSDIVDATSAARTEHRQVCRGRPQGKSKPSLEELNERFFGKSLMSQTFESTSPPKKPSLNMAGSFSFKKFKGRLRRQDSMVQEDSAARAAKDYCGYCGRYTPKTHDKEKCLASLQVASILCRRRSRPTGRQQPYRASDVREAELKDYDRRMKRLVSKVVPPIRQFTKASSSAPDDGPRFVQCQYCRRNIPANLLHVHDQHNCIHSAVVKAVAEVGVLLKKHATLVAQAHHPSATIAVDHLAASQGGLDSGTARARRLNDTELNMLTSHGSISPGASPRNESSGGGAADKNHVAAEADWATELVSRPTRGEMRRERERAKEAQARERRRTFQGPKSKAEEEREALRLSKQSLRDVELAKRERVRILREEREREIFREEHNCIGAVAAAQRQKHQIEKEERVRDHLMQQFQQKDQQLTQEIMRTVQVIRDRTDIDVDGILFGPPPQGVQETRQKVHTPAQEQQPRAARALSTRAPRKQKTRKESTATHKQQQRESTRIHATAEAGSHDSSVLQDRINRLRAEVEDWKMNMLLARRGENGEILADDGKEEEEELRVALRGIKGPLGADTMISGSKGGLPPMDHEASMRSHRSAAEGSVGRSSGRRWRHHLLNSARSQSSFETATSARSVVSERLYPTQRKPAVEQLYDADVVNTAKGLLSGSAAARRKYDRMFPEIGERFLAKKMNKELADW